MLCAALLHDIVSYPKSDGRAAHSSQYSAAEAGRILRRYGFAEGEIAAVSDAVRDHSFSGGRVPAAIEGMILQDADRLDAIGAVGLARVFATGGLLGRPLYNPDDPFCRKRGPDDRMWTLDHFYRKLLRLESMMNTDSGRGRGRKAHGHPQRVPGPARI